MKTMEFKILNRQNLSLEEFESLFAELEKSGKTLAKPLVERLAGKFIKCYSTAPQNESQPIPPINKSLVFFAKNNQLQTVSKFIAPDPEEGMTQFLKENMNGFTRNKEGIHDFIEILRTPGTPGSVKRDTLQSLLAHETLPTLMNKEDPADAQKEVVVDIFYKFYDFDVGVDLINILLNNSTSIPERAIYSGCFYFSENLIELFNKDPAQWIDSLGKNGQSIVEFSQSQYSFRKVIKLFGEYLQNPENPTETKRTLFLNTFKALSQIHEENAEILPVYIEFIFEHLQEKEIQDLLRECQGDFVEKLSKVDLPTTFSDTLIKALLKGEYRDQFQAAGLQQFYENVASRALAANLKNADSTENKDEELKIILPELIIDNIDDFSKMIFIESLNANPESEPISIPEELGTVIYDHTGYDEGVEIKSNPHFKQGEALAKGGLPIGYNIHLPKGSVKGMVVSVYSGHQAKDRAEKIELPGNLNSMEQDLLNKGYAVATLNLINLLKLEKFQDEMPEDLHTDIHDSIHHFYETITQRPEALHPDLSILKGQPIHLFGASFGGRDAVKHAELHPETFDTYTSFNGALSFDMIQKSDLKGMANRFDSSETQKWLDPSIGIEHIRKPVLILQNRNDHIVNMKVPLAWYEEAQAAGKQDLVRLHVTPKGPLAKDKLNRTGHRLAKEKAPFDNMMDAMVSFLDKGAPGLPAIPAWEAHKNQILANRHYRSATLEERFISEAYRRLGDQKFNQKRLNDDYAPLYFTLHYLEVVSQDQTQAMAEIQELRDTGQLTPEVINRGLKAFLGPFLSFIKEKEGYNIPNNLDLDTLADDPVLQDQYVTLLSENYLDYQVIHSLMSSLYVANPQLLEPQFAEFKKDSTLQKEMQEAHDGLKAKVEMERKIIAQVWQQTAKKAVAQVDNSTRKAALLQWAQEVKSKREEKQRSGPKEQEKAPEVQVTAAPLQSQTTPTSATCAEIWNNLSKHVQNVKSGDANGWRAKDALTKITHFVNNENKKPLPKGANIEKIYRDRLIALGELTGKIDETSFTKGNNKIVELLKPIRTQCNNLLSAPKKTFLKK